MGNVLKGETEEQKIAKARNKELEAQQVDDQNADQQLIKLLLLGAGESGKSTVFKQMRLLYGSGFDDESRKLVNPVICSNLVAGTQTVLENQLKLNLVSVDPEAVKAGTMVTEVVDQDRISPELANAIQLLWSDEMFQKCYEQRANYQLFDSYGEFAKKIKQYPQWGGSDWVPSQGDVMKARARTSGIVEEEYAIDGVEFRMYDVGGQRNERKKWIHCFDSVTAVIFVGAISEYDQVLFEDNSQNRLVEAVTLFEEICNSKWFQETSMILFLNKKDLFWEKFVEKKVPLQITGLDFFAQAPVVDWSNTSAEVGYKIACDWIVSIFIEKNRSTSKEIYHHITCATDSENVKTVFSACKDIILKGNLKGSGFMD